MTAAPPGPDGDGGACSDGEPTLGELSDRLDAERFVGRDDELDAIADARAGRTPTRVVHLHGPGGVGKSALLREIARRVVVDGGRCVRVDGRSVEPTKAGLTAALGPAAGSPCVVLVDEVDHLGSLRFELVALLATTLTAASVAVLAGRTRPERGWADGALAHVAVERPLRPLTHDEAIALLRRRGPIGDEEAEDLVRWSGGYPLPLAVAIESRGVAGASPRPQAGPGGLTDVEAVVMERLGGRELDDVDPDVVDVATVAPAVDGRLLAAVLPGRPTRAALEQLRASSLTEIVGGRVMLHPLLRVAARARLRETDPDRYRALVLAVADHIHDRVVADGSWWAMDLTDLVEEGPARHVFGPSATHYIDRPRPDDVAVAERMGASGTAWWARFWRWCEEAPHTVPLVRRADGTAVGMAVAAPAWAMPAWAGDEIETGPALEHAAHRERTDRTLFIHSMKVVEASPAAHAEAVRVGNLGLARTTGLKNPRWIYVTTEATVMQDVLDYGYRLVPELTRHDGEREIRTAVVDHGPGGFVGGMREIVRASQGVAPSGPGDGHGEALVDALRSYRDDGALARSRLAPGDGTGVAGVRAQVLAALDAVFDDSPEDRELVLALRRAYVDADGGHAVARQELHMSRSAFYRHLQRARERLALADG